MYLGIWIDELLTFRKNDGEQSKLARRALGDPWRLLRGRIYTVVLYISGIWGTKTFSELTHV